MKLNWLGYYLPDNGYGRLSGYMVRYLEAAGAQVTPTVFGDLSKPQWLLDRMGFSFDNLTITCSEWQQLKPISGRHMLYTMCEGTDLAKPTLRKIHQSKAQRIMVPSQFCKDVFEANGVQIPVTVVPMGTDPGDFPSVWGPEGRRGTLYRPYTFLALADRGARKGWHEVYTAFYKAFGGKTDGVKDVRLIIKSLPGSNSLAKKVAGAVGLDSRITFDMNSYASLADLYANVDCVALPPRSEGWGMPHREAAMMGLPVIVQKYAGLDDGHTEEWAIVLEKGRMHGFDVAQALGGGGTWMVADTDELAAYMLDCYRCSGQAAMQGQRAREWLRANQTWQHSVQALLRVVEDEYGFQMEVDPKLAYPQFVQEYTNQLILGGRIVAQRFETEIEDWMKENAPWNDRTGDARKSLYAEKLPDAGPVAEVVFGYRSVEDGGVPYAIWLEVAMQGRYSILGKTMDHFAPRLQRGVQGMMNLGLLGGGDMEDAVDGLVIDD